MSQIEDKYSSCVLYAESDKCGKYSRTNTDGMFLCDEMVEMVHGLSEKKLIEIESFDHWMENLCVPNIDINMEYNGRHLIVVSTLCMFMLIVIF